MATVLLPIAVAVIGIWSPELRPWTALATIVAILSDVLWLDRAQKELLVLAARIAEEFDCDVLEIPWNAVHVGSHPTDREVKALDLEHRVGPRQSQLEDWYPTSIENVPLHVARVICQLTNSQYDGRLRPLYRGALLGFSIGVLLVLGGLGILVKMDWPQLLWAVLLPCSPLLIWAGREYRRQGEANDAAKTIQDRALELWADTASDAITSDQATIRSRSVQDLIFQHRSRAPLALPVVYDLLRSRLEEKMMVSADDRLEQWRARH